ncbi:MAG: PAS domain S-box protein [Pyrinomonadaceae bacterium]|nr:PAS domain S-box protein [Pyrinomonadaceae bacterium]
MVSESRKTGISVVGDAPWGTHLCHFYETKQDLLDILIPYFKAGLENDEFCMWVVADPLGQEEARNAFRQSVPDADRYLGAGRIEIVPHRQTLSSRRQTSSAGSLEIVPHTDWYLKGGAFAAMGLLEGWNKKLDEALAKGQAGMRVNGNESWLTEENRKDFLEYERTLDENLSNKRMIVLCSYPLSTSSATQVVDVVNAHQLGIIRRGGDWEVLETQELRQAKQEIKRLNDELEQRVIQRTSELAAANEELRREISERQRAEEALRESQRKLEEAQRIAHVGHWERDLQTGLITWSDEVYRIFGLSPREKDLPLTEWLQFLHPEDRERVARVIEEVERGIRRYDVEFRIVRPDGEVRYAHSQGDITRDEQGGARRFFGIGQDITERKRAEEALRKSENLWRTIFNDAAIGMAIVNPEGRPVETNPAFQKLLGYTKEELRHLWFVDFTHPDDTIKEFLLHQEMIDGKRDHYQIEKRYIRKDGQVRWVNLTASVIPAEQPGEFFGVGMVEDVTERKMAEEALRRSEDHLRLVLDTTPALIHTARPDGYLDYFNQRSLEYLGRSLEEIQGWGWTASIHPDDVEGIVNEWRASLASGEPLQHEARVRQADGEYRWMLHCKVPLRDEHGNIVKWYGSSIDIEDRKQAEMVLDERLCFETLVTELSAAFANLSPNEVDHEIDKWLQTLVEVLGVDRASFFQFGEDWTTLYRSHSYTVPGIQPLPPAPIGMKDQFPWITDQLRRGVTVKWSRIPDDMPEEAAKEKEYAARMGVKSGLNIPVRMGGSVICAITFTSIASYRDWPDAMVARLRLVGEIFAAAVERKRSEEQLKQSESQLAEAQHMAHLGSWNWDLQSNTLSWSDELYHIFGIDRQAFNPAHEDFVAEFVHVDDRAKVRGITESALKARKPYSFDNRIVRPDGEDRVIHVRGDIVSDAHENPVRVFGTAQDVTERKRAEEKLETTSEQLRALSARLQSAREEEGIRIARELHDELGAALTSLKWDLEEAVEVMSESTDLAQIAGLRTKLEGMIGLTDTTVNAVRRIVSELRPTALDELGLSEAVEWQARQFQDRTGIFVHCDCVVEPDELSREQSIAAFRISQEALTNILRHAQATTVHIQMRTAGGEFILTISDNGRGITEEEKLGRRTLGILGMRERAHLIGGTIDFTGSQGKGTVVTVRIPIFS